MATVKKSALVLYSAAEMYALVGDIEAYPRFLPWCRSSRVLSSNDDEVRATIEMVKGGIHKSFTTCNRMQRHKMIDIRLLEGPFKRLEGYWRFEPLRADASKVSLDMEFEFANHLLRMAVEPVFKQIANSLVDAFCKRAVDLYGKR
ncbi:MAG TPA: type II toxin-antitoxin system RatA family toxin [Candidatus Competibacter sp.]|nr:type II toxin-antitoxin system RatA family toxin [Candidatus Competibacter sp.]MCC9001791.1 type II toxin-antitoxin system RatA family toxin [Candidatus Competibacter sp.]HRX60667.1 type II toxin-antitoxin system RatA family toxin [Candidatus Competibacter sp.]HUM91381.1 type II toxin-antitoxin system RatA family toxin [Candidatus Competibacter sp.]